MSALICVCLSVVSSADTLPLPEWVDITSANGICTVVIPKTDRVSADYYEYRMDAGEWRRLPSCDGRLTLSFQGVLSIRYSSNGVLSPVLREYADTGLYSYSVENAAGMFLEKTPEGGFPGDVYISAAKIVSGKYYNSAVTAAENRAFLLYEIALVSANAVFNTGNAFVVGMKIPSAMRYGYCGVYSLDENGSVLPVAVLYRDGDMYIPCNSVGMLLFINEWNGTGTAYNGSELLDFRVADDAFIPSDPGGDNDNPGGTGTENPSYSGSGDVDFSGKVTSADARLALRMAVKLENGRSEEAFAAADMDGDGKVTSADARIILRLAVGLS